MDLELNNRYLMHKDSHDHCGFLSSACHCVWHSLPSVCRLSQHATCDKPKVGYAKRSEKTKSHKKLTQISWSYTHNYLFNVVFNSITKRCKQK